MNWKDERTWYNVSPCETLAWNSEGLSTVLHSCGLDFVTTSPGLQYPSYNMLVWAR